MSKRCHVSAEVRRNLSTSIWCFPSNLIRARSSKNLVLWQTLPMTLQSFFLFDFRTWYSRYEHSSLNSRMMGFYGGIPCFLGPSALSVLCFAVLSFWDLWFPFRRLFRSRDSYKDLPSVLSDSSSEEEVLCEDSEDDESLDSSLTPMFLSSRLLFFILRFLPFRSRASYHAICRSFLENCLFGLPRGFCFWVARPPSTHNIAVRWLPQSFLL